EGSHARALAVKSPRSVRMFLAVTSESKVIAGKDLERAVNACTTQIKQHVAPTWDRIPAHIILCEDKKEIPAVADVVTVLDVSNFVYRLFFDGRAPAACQFDHLRRVRGPFTPSAGGYMHLRKIGEMQMIRGGPEGIL